MNKKRIVQKDEASEKTVGSIVVRTYFLDISRHPGLATATINGPYPSKNKRTSVTNLRVEEIWRVIEGTGTIKYEDGERFQFGPESGVYIPHGLRYRVEEARDLRVVVSTGPAWSADQHKFCTD
jgi:mannose-6-phosphate isomerase-like protein (cupin superfamily)